MGGKGRVLVGQFLRFHLVGAGTLLVGTLVFLGLVALGCNYVIALGGDYAVGILFSYFMNKAYTFKAKVHSDVKPLSATVLSYLLTFLLNVLLLSIAVEVYAFDLVYSQILIMVALAVMNFLMFKFWIFGRLALAPRAATASRRGAGKGAG